MILRPFLAVVAVSAAALCVAPGAAKWHRGTAPDPASVVTTDSLNYCHTLERVIEERAPTTFQNVRVLENQGAALCNSGHVRPGIDRLREALRLLRHA